MNIGFVCPVPIGSCQGSPVAAGPGAGGRAKYHGDDKQVRRCQQRYLESQGYQRLSPREFRAPDGSGVLVLSKKPGTPVRTGKAKRSQADAHTKAAW